MSQEAKGDDAFIISYSRGGTAKNTRISSDVIHSTLKQYVKKGGLRKPVFKMHMFRATHASDLRHICGYDMAAISQRLGHKHLSSTERYFPSWDRISKEEPSLAVYWKEWTHIWKEKMRDADDAINDQGEETNARTI